MNGYICTKACQIGGVVYQKGDAIPFDDVFPARERALIQMGYISPVLETASEENISKKYIGETEEPRFFIPVPFGEDQLVLSMTQATLLQVFAVMRLTVKDATAEVANITDESILILLDSIESRVTLKKAVEERLISLGTEEADPAEAGGDD